MNRRRGGTRLLACTLIAALAAVALLGVDFGAGVPHVNLAAAQEEATSTPDTQQPNTATATGTPLPTATRSAEELSKSIRATATARAQVTLTAAAVATNIALTPTATQTPTLTSTPTPSATPTPSPTPTPGPDEILDARIDRMIAEMSVADRVGQLFVVTFQGSDAGPRSDIAELIEEYRVGGVIISPNNRNFSNYSEEPKEDVARLTNQLQALAFGLYLAPTEALNAKEGAATIPGILPSSLEQKLPLELPLLIGVEQGGDGLPVSVLRAGFTAIPPQMALGATWNPELVEEVGAVLGRELRSVGVNLLLGPTLDVMEQPRPDLVAGFGLHAFGGEPFWVGRLGQAYVTGIHRGSDGRIATVAGHFPGQGGTDRRPEEEIATIQKSLQELQRIELPPFAAVAERPSAILRVDGSEASTEALMSGHIRFSSFQGSRERTPPISLAQELGVLLDLDEFASWRAHGGILMSDALGVPAVRRYYDPQLQEFPRRRIALDAFTAGNDLLYLADFSLTDSWLDARANIKETIIFFRERYTNDAEFAAQVDASLHRVLRLKLRLYDPGYPEEMAEDTQAMMEVPIEVDIANVLVGPDDLAEGFGPDHRKEAQTLLDQVAGEALTIFFPDSPGLTDPLPAPPAEDENILIFTDSRILHECDVCPPEPAVEPTALEEIMLRLYGPEATNQLKPEQIRSRGFFELNSLLNGTADEALADELDEEILNADWLIFAMLDVDVANYESSDAVKQFLRLRSDRLPGSKLVVLALNEPYFFDSTEIGKMTAYLGVYSKTQPFLEAAVRALFRSRAQPVRGAPPVSVPGTRFSNLVERLEPDPNQTIGLTLLNEGIVFEETEENEVIVAQADLSLGDILELQAGPILDRNGNMVPDGTPVNFLLVYEGEEFVRQVNPVGTRGGYARRSVPLEQAGTLVIAVSSVEATSSTEISVSIPAADGEGDRTRISISDPISPPAPTQTPPPPPTAEPTAQAVPTPVPTPVLPENVEVDVASLAVALVTQLMVLALLLVVLVQVMPRQLLVHRLLWAMIVGWCAYILYGLGAIPGGVWIQVNLYPWDSVPIVVIGMLIPLVWLQFRAE